MRNNLKLNSINKIKYINSYDNFAIFKLKSELVKLIKKFNKKNQIIILCIGTDRATGDSLGPLVGYKLSRLPLGNNVIVYGDLEKPVHAQNLEETLQEIEEKYKNKHIIAIDASLGNKNYINYITVGEGSLAPGAGINKKLPKVGDIFITGIVNVSGLLELSVLQNTRLGVVMNMADIISSGLWVSLYTGLR